MPKYQLDGHNKGVYTPKRFSCTFTNDDVQNAYNLVRHKINHTDSPTVQELIYVRDKLEELVDANLEMVCTNWLRNKIVTLRKDNRLEKQEKES